jgi:hypothetical protein
MIVDTLSPVCKYTEGMKMKRLMTMMFGLCVVSAAGAANDPDSTGRLVKYLDSMNSMIISYYTPDSQCFQFAPSAPPPLRPITCVPLVGAGFETLPLTSVGEIAVAANESRSLLSLNMQPVAQYNLRNAGTARSTLIMSGQVKVTIESSVLNDLVNPTTGQPFGGKIEMTYQWFYDQRAEEPTSSFGVATKIPFEMPILSRKILTSVYGLSATRAATVFARPITVKISATGNLLGSGSANFFMNGRLFGD